MELLVVVLIIGILAAIALPKYRKAVVKAEAKQLILNVKALAEAQQRFYLTNNRYADSFGELDIDFSGFPKHNCPKYQGYFNISDCISNDKSVLWFSNNFIAAMINDDKYFGSGFRHDYKRIMCYYNAGIGTNNLCTEVFNCTKDNISSGSNNYYNCPEL